MTGDQLQGLAAIVTAIGGLGASVCTLVMQMRNSRVSRENSAKLDVQGAKIEEVHAATAAIAESTGTHKALDGG